jgi:hypothetical protein
MVGSTWTSGTGKMWGRFGRESMGEGNACGNIGLRAGSVRKRRWERRETGRSAEEIEERQAERADSSLK